MKKTACTLCRPSLQALQPPEHQAARQALLVQVAGLVPELEAYLLVRDRAGWGRWRPHPRAFLDWGYYEGIRAFEGL